MTSLFEPVRVGAWSLRNRVVMAPLTRNRSPGAVPTASVATYYRQRATAGLIVTEATAISAQAQGYADVPGLYAPAQLAAWRRVTDAVHAEGGTIVVQLWHVGRISHTTLQPGGVAPVAPSALVAKSKTALMLDGQPTFVETSTPRALSLAEIPGIVADYARAARAAVEVAGFDGVEIHGANGYLLDQFLKTGANHRTDAYGGSIEHRARLMLEVAQAVAGAVGGARTGLRLSPVTPSNDIVDADPQPLYDHLLRRLAPLGLAYLHLVEGATGGARELPERPFDFDAARRAWREAGATGAWMVNNGYDAALAQAAVAEGRADLVAFGRPFIANPDLVRRLREGAPLNPPDRATFYGGDDRGYLDYPTLDAAPQPA
jgi:N-ethylmaleimide reductase